MRGGRLAAPSATYTYGHLDGSSLVSDGLVMPIKYRQLVPQLFALGEGVPDVGMLRDEAEGLLLPV